MLSGGPTAKRCYEHLSAATGEIGAGLVRPPSATPMARSGTVPMAHPAFDWSLVDIYMGDERLVPPDDDDANQRLVREAIVDRVGILGSFRPMPTTGPVEECVADLPACPGRRSWPGPGSTSSTWAWVPTAIRPRSSRTPPPSMLPPDLLVAATQDPNGQNAHPRLTVTLPVINAARCAVFTVAGESKRDAVAALRRGDDIPAARVRASRVVWLIDRAASG